MKALAPACPVKVDVEEILAHELGMLFAMRRLRRSLKRCKGCPSARDCPVYQNFNAQIDQALQEVNEEFSLIGAETRGNHG